MTRGQTIGVAVALALATALAPRPAQAQVETMRAEMHRFFDAEVTGSWIWFIEGLAVSAAAGSVLLFYDGEGEDFWRGAAIPVLVIGVAQLGTGGSILLRTPGQVDELDAQLTANPASYRHDELERMERINFQYDLVRVVEIALFAAGAGMITYGLIADDARFLGAGIGLAAQILFTFITDIFAAARAEEYTEALERFTP
jgi:hypothetical protein